MKREIKFRAWSREPFREVMWHNVIVGGDVAFYAYESDELKNVFTPHFWTQQGQKDESIILMQFTGLCDIDGRGIYDGDIIAGPSTEHIPCPVSWEDDLAMFVVTTYHSSEPLHEFDKVHVIGNIYENPELLK